jgi:hypothetical protein
MKNRNVLALSVVICAAALTGCVNVPGNERPAAASPTACSSGPGSLRPIMGTPETCLTPSEAQARGLLPSHARH